MASWKVLRAVAVGALATLATTMPAPTSVSLDSDNKIPMQHRLAYAGTTGMHVRWNPYSKLSKPSVRYGTSPYSLDMETSSNVSVTYQTSTTYNNHVKITGLKPDALYYYRPIYDNCTTPYTFKTSKPAGDGSSMTVAVVMDLGTMGADG